MENILTSSIAKTILKYDFSSNTKKQAIERLESTCKKFNTNLHLIGSDYSKSSITEIDETRVLILSF